MTSIDPAALDAIDVHVHVEQDGHGCFALDQELLDAMPVEHSGAAAFDAQRAELVRVLAASLPR